MGDITIIGTGWTEEQLTIGAVKAFKSAEHIILHTDHSGCGDWLRENGIDFDSLDRLYEECEDFDEHIEEAVDVILEAAADHDVIYGVLDVRDRTVSALMEKAADRMRIIAGPSAEGALLAYVNGAALMLEASDWEDFRLFAGQNCIIREVDNRELASEVKLKLMEVYPEECQVWVLQRGCAPISVPLYDLDRMENFDHRTCVYVPAQDDLMSLERYSFDHINSIIRRLCGPGGCPWDRAQTHETLRTCMLEEAYEVMEAIDEQDPDHLYDELGDMLLQIVLHAEIARRHGEFDISDVTTAISEKMIQRHTHIFGNDRAADPDQVLDLWNRNKKSERGFKRQTEVLRSITKTLPALLRCVKTLKRSGDVGVCELTIENAVESAVNAVALLNSSVEDETSVGNALMLVCDAARIKKVDPEIALNKAVDRFIDRFDKLEQDLNANGVDLDKIEPERLQKYWDSVKL